MTPGQKAGTDAVAALIREAGRRQPPPEQAAATVWPAVVDTFRARVRRRRRQRLAVGMAATIAALASAALLLQARLPATAPVMAGRIDRIVGVVESRPPGAGAWQPTATAAGQQLAAGSLVRTGPDGLAGLVLASGASVRLAAETEVELGEAAHVRLSRGRLYADTGPAGRHGPVEIRTPAGVARDFGTQFEVRFASGTLRLRVREGQVVLDRDDHRLVASAGEQLEVDGAGDVSRTPFPPGDAGWAWAEALAPSLDIDGQPVRVLLEWVARETGRPLRYADAEAESRADTTILHGRVGQLAPLEVLDLMLPTTDLTYAILGDGTIEVRLD